MRKSMISRSIALMGFVFVLAIASSCEHENPSTDYYPLPKSELTYRVEYYYADWETGERRTYGADTISLLLMKDTTIQNIQYNMIGGYGADGKLVDIDLIRKSTEGVYERVAWFDSFNEQIHDLGAEFLFFNDDAPVGTIISTDQGSEYTITEKGITMDVNGVTYKNVIKITQRPICCDFTADRYYAPHVGLIFSRLPNPISLRYSDADWSLLPN